MFTGLIEEIGEISSIRRGVARIQFKIKGKKVLDELNLDHSISVNGVCLTVVNIGEYFFEADAVEETLLRTTLKDLKIGDRVNLERALRFSDRLGGHLVQGHVDGIGRILKLERQAENGRLTVELPGDLLPYVIQKGSIAIDGISLTIAKLNRKNITMSIIPHTLRSTTLMYKRTGQTVNIEVDLIGKYVERLMNVNAEPTKITESWLHGLGY